MKTITKEMIKIYRCKDVCWMGYVVTRDNPYTFHHIIKKENGGKEVFDNGALLSKTGHDYLHIVEYKEIDIYREINKILKDINSQGYAPTLVQLLTIDELLKCFEEDYLKAKTRKGKTLIKYQYTQRNGILL